MRDRQRQKQRQTETDRDRHRDRHRDRQRQRDTETETETDRDRNRDRQRQRDTETETETDRDRNRDRQRQTQRQTERHRDRNRQTDRQTDTDRDRDREREPAAMKRTASVQTNRWHSMLLLLFHISHWFESELLWHKNIWNHSAARKEEHKKGRREGGREGQRERDGRRQGGVLQWCQGCQRFACNATETDWSSMLNLERSWGQKWRGRELSSLCTLDFIGYSPLNSHSLQTPMARSAAQGQWVL